MHTVALVQLDGEDTETSPVASANRRSLMYVKQLISTKSVPQPVDNTYVNICKLTPNCDIVKSSVNALIFQYAKTALIRSK